MLAIGAVSSFVLPFDYNPPLIATLGQVDMWITPSVMIALVPLTGKSMYHSSLTLSGTNVGPFFLCSKWLKIAQAYGSGFRAQTILSCLLSTRSCSVD